MIVVAARLCALLPLVVCTVLLGAPVLAADAVVPAPTQRLEIPIGQMRAGNDIVYSVPITIAGKTINAALDSGSTGIRVLGKDLPGDAASMKGRPENTSFSDGDQLKGIFYRNAVSFAGAPAQQITMEDVQKVACLPDRKTCESSRYPGKIMGGADVGAIIGTSLPRPNDGFLVPNPLLSFGNSWIVELPRPGQGAPGKLIINPTVDELQGFADFPAGQGFDVGSGRDNPIPGCLTNRRNGRQFCGAIVLDTGMPQIFVITNQFAGNRYWSPDTLGQLSFHKPDGGKLSASFIVSKGLPATRVNLGKLPRFGQPPERVLAGDELFMLFDVLYDFSDSKLGLRLR